MQISDQANSSRDILPFVKFIVFQNGHLAPSNIAV